MNREELISKIAESANITKKQAGLALTAFIDTVTTELEKKGKVSLVGFGSFSVNHRKARKGKNPKTGEVIDIEARDVPVFKAGKKLKDAVK
jgi:DNA-binding protein HU-beta